MCLRLLSIIQKLQVQETACGKDISQLVVYIITTTAETVP